MSNNLPRALLFYTRRQRLIRVYLRFDSSVGRGAFVTRIGVGQVIKGTSYASIIEDGLENRSLTVRVGWDEGVTTMKLGEKATLDITR